MAVHFLRRLALASGLVLASTSSIAGLYTFHDLGVIEGDYSVAYGLNDHRQVVGESSTASGFNHAFLWSAATGMQDLGVVGGDTSRALSINNSGQFIGSSTTGFEEQYVPFSGSSTPITGLFPVPEGMSAYGMEVNESGLIAGDFYEHSTGNRQGFVYNSATNELTMLGSLGGGFSSVLGMNDNGDIVGYSSTGIGAPHAFLYSGGVMQDLGSLGTVSFGFDINNAGLVSGRSRVTDEFGAPSYRAFFWDALNGMTDLGTFGFQSASIRELNNSGLGLGWGSNNFFADPSVEEASFESFIYNLTTGSVLYLNDLLPASSGWDRIQFAYDINEHGDVVGYGRMEDGSTHAFLLMRNIEVPVPAAALLMVFAVLVFRRKMK